ncbi:MAG: ABC transporter permease subunit [Planctomycetota bacterium]
MPSDESQRSRRSLRTTRSVRVAEVLSRVLITGGGIGTIAAVTLIFVFLVATVMPLFTSGEVEAEGRQTIRFDEPLVHAAVDEYELLVALLFRDGSVEVQRLDDGSVVGRRAAFERRPTAWSVASNAEKLAWGRADGSVQLATFGFETVFPTEDELPPGAEALGTDGVLSIEDGVVQRTVEGALRAQRFHFDVSPPVDTGLGAEISAIATVPSGNRTVAAILAENGALVRGRFTVSPFDETLLTFRSTALPHEVAPGAAPPRFITINELGDSIVVAGENGLALRYDVRAGIEPSVAEAVDLLPGSDASITALDTLLGHGTLLVGDSAGGVRGWFTSQDPNATTPDGVVLVPAHEFERGAAAVSAFASSSRSRAFAIAYEDDLLRVAYMTNERIVAETRSDVDGVELLRISPKEDGLFAFGAGAYERWSLSVAHPAASFRSFFGKVWYEGYDRPDSTWQAESATDDFEPKFGFGSLIYGTLKATFYSMLFGAPLALLAAIFTSEFLDRRLRVPIKSSIEIMASLPSVVLGFLAGLVIAPFVQSILPAVMASFLTVPFMFLVGAYVWQLLPQGIALRASGWPRLALMSLALPLGLAAAAWCGPLLERLYFAGDIFAWLDGQRGHAATGWALVMLPVAAVVVVLLATLVAGASFRRWTSGMSRAGVAARDLARFVVGALLTFGLAWVAGTVLESLGLDPRNSFLGAFDQRNALVVGFAMGFAIVPIIYTLAEDALSSVPQHLRLASLGAGATHWQTAIRIVVPTAMSGLFSAVMIGFGRAVGETMIVLMATGNTPIMDMNIFSGFRTLSANIAVELPEAVVGSTHYRALFLAGLVLFGMTFVLNTIAELVRLRYRKRSVQL